MSGSALANLTLTEIGERINAHLRRIEVKQRAEAARKRAVDGNDHSLSHWHHAGAGSVVISGGGLEIARRAAARRRKPPPAPPFGTAKDRLMGALGFAATVCLLCAPNLPMFLAYLVHGLAQSEYWRDRTRQQGTRAEGER